MNREPMHDDYDDLDRAIFGLDLATPPHGLRESILRATIYTLPAATPAYATRDVLFAGVMFAVAALLALYALADRSFGPTLASDASAVIRALGNTTTLTWLATGGVVAAFAQFVQGVPLRLPVRTHRP